MPFTFSQRTGIISAPDGRNLYTGYSGQGEGRCNPAFQHIRNEGPLPQGRYRISGPECTHFSIPANSSCPVCADCGGTSSHHHGPFVLRLTPIAPPAHPVYTEDQQELLAKLTAEGDPQPWMFRRAGMLNHGDNATHTASEGCMISDHGTRGILASGSHDDLEVIA